MRFKNLAVVLHWKHILFAFLACDSKIKDGQLNEFAKPHFYTRFRLAFKLSVHVFLCACAHSYMAVYVRDFLATKLFCS